MIITRLPDWRPRLSDHLTAIACTPFEYGRHDCGLFTADCIAAMTTVDLARDFRGQYQTFKGALKLLKQAGYDDHQGLVAAHFAPVPAAFAQVGDIMVLDVAGIPALGINVGERIAALQASGLAMAPFEAARAAYRVP